MPDTEDREADPTKLDMLERSFAATKIQNWFRHMRSSKSADLFTPEVEEEQKEQVELPLSFSMTSEASSLCNQSVLADYLKSQGMEKFGLSLLIVKEVMNNSNQPWMKHAVKQFLGL